MKISSLYVCLFVSISSFVANAQTVTPPNLAQEQTDNTISPPTDLTPEQKIELRKGLMKNIQNTAVNSDALERKHLMNAIENMKKIRIRQENLGKPENEKIEYKKPNVNLNNRRDFQKYIQNSYLQDLDTSEDAQNLLSPKQIPTEETEETSPTTSNSQE